MNIWIALLAALAGYLMGSISSARLVTRAVKPETDLTRVEVPLGEDGDLFVSDSVSATMVRIKVGTRYGVYTALLDMLKVALPTLLFYLWQLDAPYYLIVAAAGLVGHDWPIYHHFQGGRGESAIYGGLLVIAPLGAVVTLLAGTLLGLLLGNILVLRWGGLLLMIPWMVFAVRSPAHIAYILFVNGVYWFSMMPELRQYFSMVGAGKSPSQEEIAAEFGMGSRLGRVLDCYSIPGLLARQRGQVPGRQGD